MISKYRKMWIFYNKGMKEVHKEIKPIINIKKERRAVISKLYYNKMYKNDALYFTKHERLESMCRDLKRHFELLKMKNIK